MSRTTEQIAMPVDVELFISPYCVRCAAARKTLEAILSGDLREAIRYRERSVLEHLERAVELGVTRTPALVIDGRLVAIHAWRTDRCRQAILDYLENRGP